MSTRSLTIGAALLAGLLAGCNDSKTGDVFPSSTEGDVQVRVTDAPFPVGLVDSALVTITKVDLQTDDGNITTVFEGSADFDLTQLTGGVAELLADTEIASGTYERVLVTLEPREVVLGPGAIAADGNAIFSVSNGKLALGSIAGFAVESAINPPLDVSPATDADLTLDIELDRSFIFQGPVDRSPGVRRIVFAPNILAVNTDFTGLATIDIFTDNGTPNDSADDILLEGATVTIIDDNDGTTIARGFTDNTGRARINVVDGTFDVRLEAPGHDTLTVDNISVNVDETTVITPMTLLQSNLLISGQIMSDAMTDADLTDDLVAGGATVELLQTGSVVAMTTADAQGRFQFDGLSAGTYDVRATAPGHDENTSDGIVLPAANASADVVLPAFSRLVQGQVSDATGDSVQGLQVEALRVDGFVAGLATVNGQGAYELSLPSATYALRLLDSNGDELARASITVEGTDPESAQQADSLEAP